MFVLKGVIVTENDLGARKNGGDFFVLGKWATIKMVGITTFYLGCAVPFGIIFTYALVATPTTTLPLDKTFVLFWLNASLQPIIYILAFSKLRKRFLQLFCSAHIRP